MANIFEYTDFRAYLKDYYKEKKKKNPLFSYEALTQRTGFNNRGFIYNVINGNKKLSLVHCHKLSHALGHNKNEAEYFENITFYTQGTNEKDRSIFLEKALQIKSSIPTPSHMLRKDQYEYFSTWYHSAIRSLIDVFPFKDDYIQLSRMLSPPITEVQAKKSIQLLERLRFITKNDDGFFHITETSLKAGNGISQTAKNRYHVEYTELAKESISNFDPEIRNVSSLTLGISEQTYKAICDETELFKNRIKNLANNDNDADRVYQYQLILFPLTGVERKQ